jgi:hypothetical protein
MRLAIAQLASPGGDAASNDAHLLEAVALDLHLSSFS